MSDLFDEHGNDPSDADREHIHCLPSQGQFGWRLGLCSTFMMLITTLMAAWNGATAPLSIGASAALAGAGVISLRDYQQGLVKEVRDSLKAGRRRIAAITSSNTLVMLKKVRRFNLSVEA